MPKIELAKNDLMALGILALMAALMFFSVFNASATMDELAHIPAGYSYLLLRDYRLNPEHPPLIKDLAAVPLTLQKLNFPTDTAAWQEDVNGQWVQGRIFLYEAGNDADSIIFWARIPMMALAIFFGWLFFWWVRKNFGVRAGILALLFYAFSPTVLAHSNLVTTDLAAAFAFFIGIITFLRFLEEPTRKNVLIAGLVFGAAELLKFSLVLLVPIYAALLVVWVLAQMHLRASERLRLFLKLLGKSVVIGLVGLLLIWGVYAYHVWNYPAERQISDAELILGTFGARWLVDAELWMIQQPLLRPLAHYFLGVLMVTQRIAGGNTVYFLGEVSNTGSALYFPTMYFLKEALAFHVLSLIALGFALWKILGVRKKSLAKVLWWARDHYIEAASWLFITFYWAWSIRSPLNIGVRHLLPTFPFIYMLVAKELAHWLAYKEYTDPHTWYGFLKNVYQLYVKSIPKYLVVGVLTIWLVSGALIAFPYFLPYYNELAGGTDNGYKYAVDSNYDWGQDLRRLSRFVEENDIDKIALDYFGGGEPRYYLGGKFEPWSSARGPASGWFAISATFQMEAFGKAAPGFIKKEESPYEWLKQYQPVARAGKSIFIYRLP